MKAWLFQDTRQKKKLGEDKCPWSVGWLDPDGKRKSKRIGSKSQAEKFRRKTEGELAAGTYNCHSRKQWDDFKEEYHKKIASGMSPQNRRCTLEALKHFEEIIEPKHMRAIKTQTIAEFVATRRMQSGKKKGSIVSPATVNKELRHIRAVLRIAFDWEYLPKLPKFTMLREPKKLVRYVTPEHFARIYLACDVATLPNGLPFAAGIWWRTFLTFSYMTGWRVSEPLALRRGDLDLENSTAITRHTDNKGNRDDIVPLHPIVVDHLRQIASFEPVVFPWYHGREMLWIEFRRIQEKAGIKLDCMIPQEHEHTPACFVYGFHDLRRAFATVNADTMTPDALQSLMRHQSYTTTQRYINMARQLNRAVEALYVPSVLEKAASSA